VKRFPFPRSAIDPARVRPVRLGALIACGFAALGTGCNSTHADACGGCPTQQVCVLVPLDDGGTTAACGTVSDTAGPCGISPLAVCNDDAGLSCFGFGGPEGACFQICDPQNPSCPSGLSCLPALSTYESGICAEPAPDGARCDASQLLFCPTGQVCMGEGTCLKRCDPSLTTSECPQLETCVRPSPFQPELAVCVQPEPVGNACSPLANVYCDNGALCVYLSPDAGQGECLLDCTDGGVCPPPQTCRPVSEQGMTIQLGVCY